MAERDKPEFTLADVQEAINVLDIEDQHIVLASLGRLAEERREAEEEQSVLHDIVVLAIWYERAFADSVSFSNIEGWTHDTGERAEEVLRSLAKKSQLNELEILARDTAAIVYVWLTSDIDDDVDFELLVQAGIDPKQLPEQLGPDVTDPLASRLRAKLIESGIVLPELNKEGMYGDEEEDRDDPKFYMHRGKKYYI
jgi:hypothetical protein